MRFFFAIPILLLATACGGGGGSSPGVPAVPPAANTSLPYYLPLAAGNTWTFSTGGRFVDVGSGTLQCTCAYNGGKIEGHDLISSAGSYGGTFEYAKAAGVAGSGATVTYLVGISTDHGQTIQLLGSVATTKGVVPGLGVMDDAPSASETFSDASGDTSTIGSVNQTVTYGGATYTQVATDTISGTNVSSIVFGFARGVGYTSVSYQGQSATLASYSVNKQTSYIAPRGMPRVTRATGPLDAGTVATVLAGIAPQR